MEIVDTHTHLYLDQFDDDFDETVRRSIENNISKFVFPSISSKYYNKMIDCKRKYPKNIFLMLGLHPVYVWTRTTFKNLNLLKMRSIKIILLLSVKLD